MKNIGETMPVRYSFKRCILLNLCYPFLTKTFLMIFFLFVFQIIIQAQCIVNNVIEAVSPICAGSKAFVKGSVPSGGNGTFEYTWQVNAHDCGNSFEDIAGANGPNYVVPTSLEAKCIKRIKK